MTISLPSSSSCEIGQRRAAQHVGRTAQRPFHTLRAPLGWVRLRAPPHRRPSGRAEDDAVRCRREVGEVGSNPFRTHRLIGPVPAQGWVTPRHAAHAPFTGCAALARHEAYEGHARHLTRLVQPARPEVQLAAVNARTANLTDAAAHRGVAVTSAPARGWARNRSDKHHRSQARKGQLWGSAVGSR